MWGRYERAVLRMICSRSFSVSSMSMWRCMEAYCPEYSLMTEGTFTKSTRARKSKAPAICEPDTIRTVTPL